MSEAEDWAVIVRAKNQEIQKWQQQALELSNLVAPLRDEVARLRGALELCDPKGDRARLIVAKEDELIRDLCERIGYGAVMDSAARLWRQKDPLGAFTIGPCVATVQAALAPQGGKGGGDVKKG